MMAAGAPAQQMDEFTRLLSVLSNPKKTAAALAELKSRTEEAEAAEAALLGLRERLEAKEASLEAATVEIEQERDKIALQKAQLSAAERTLRMREDEATRKRIDFEQASALRLSILEGRAKAVGDAEKTVAVKEKQVAATLTAAQRDAEAAASLRSEYEAKMAKLKELMG